MKKNLLFVYDYRYDQKKPENFNTKMSLLKLRRANVRWYKDGPLTLA